jgi:hypothetical protein
MKKAIFGVFVVLLAASPGWAAGLKLVIHDGKVSIDAQNVTLRQILTEWARVGKTRIVNLERVTSGPMTLQLDNVSEQQALDILLRTMPGYVAAPRPAMVPDASVYDRILIMVTTTALAPRPQSQSFPAQPSNVTQLRPVPAPPTLNPGVLPEPADDSLDLNNPAIAAAAAAGLITIPAPAPAATALTPPPLREPIGPQRQPSPQTPPANSSPTNPSNPWNAPAGTSLPGLAPTPPVNRPNGPPRPPQPDQ